MKSLMSRDNVVIGIFILGLVYLFFQFKYIKEEKYTEFSEDYEKELEGRLHEIKVMKMADIMRENDMLNKGTVNLEETHLILDKMTEDENRNDIKYNDYVSKKDKDDWKMSPESKGWLSDSTEYTVPSIYTEIPRSLPY